MSHRKPLDTSPPKVGLKELIDSALNPQQPDEEEEEANPLLSYVYDNLVGRGLVCMTPFGDKEIIYCDYVASGKPTEFTEEYMQNTVQPFYGNTHTETSHVSVQTTTLREEARDIIKKSVNATEDDALIFVDSGVTGAIYKIMNVMELRGEKAANTAVITSPYEHHSNMLMWKAAGCKVMRVRQNNIGMVDFEDFEKKLVKAKQGYERVICTFSAASNVTGIMTDTLRVTKMAHDHGALAFLDYAAAGPYIHINMNTNQYLAYDAIFLSPHKFVSGPGTPGVLIAKKALFTNLLPTVCGGGTVLYVTRRTATYLDDIEIREEGGTPQILSDIRTGLTFQLKDAIGAKVIEAQEQLFFKQAVAVWKENLNLYILGCLTPKRLPTFSFLVRHPETGKFLHHNFVSTLLNDLYGIQSRGGCACAGPYAQDLMNIPETMSLRFGELLQEHEEGGEEVEALIVMKPGFTRVNLPFFFDDETLHYVIEAVDMIATHGWRLLPQYTFDNNTGVFTHLGEKVGNFKQMLFSLNDISYDDSGMHVHQPEMPFTQPSYDKMAAEAVQTFQNARTTATKIRKEWLTDEEEELTGDLSERERKLLWFLLPSEALDIVLHPFTHDVERTKVPFVPRHQSQCRRQWGNPSPLNRPSSYTAAVGTNRRRVH